MVLFIGSFIKIRHPSRLFLSSKSFPKVKEDIDIPDVPGDGVGWEGNIQLL